MKPLVSRGGENKAATDAHDHVDWWSTFPTDLASLGAAAESLGQLGALELLEQDGRPTFIIERQPPGQPVLVRPCPRVVFCNRSLLSSTTMLGRIQAKIDGGILTSRFRAWAQREHGTFAYHGLLWSSFTLRDSWKVVTGSPHCVAPFPSPELSPLQDRTVWMWEASPSMAIDIQDPGIDIADSTVAHGQPTEASKYPVLGEPGSDWTRPSTPPVLSGFTQFARKVDWAGTPFGAMCTWTKELRQLVNLVMSSPNPTLLCWTHELHTLYNQGFSMLAGQAHPGLIGQSLKEHFPELWDRIYPLLAQGQASGETVKQENCCYYLQRQPGRLDETYFNLTLVPLFDVDDGSVAGLFLQAEDTTYQNMAERRGLALRKISNSVASSKNLKGFWKSLIAALGADGNEFEIPFAKLYSVMTPDPGSRPTPTISDEPSFDQLYLEGEVRLPGFCSSPPVLYLNGEHEGAWWRPALLEALETGKPAALRLEVGTRSEVWFQENKARGHGDQGTGALICPIRAGATKAGTLGFLCVGLNPRRGYDSKYEGFVESLCSQLDTSVSAVLQKEEAFQRARTEVYRATLARTELVDQLATAQHGEEKFQNLAEIISVGLGVMNLEGQIVHCNNYWLEITGLSYSENACTMGWMSCVADEDLAAFKTKWNFMIANKHPTEFEFRLKRKWVGKGVMGGAIEGPTWILGNVSPQLVGDKTRIFAVLTETSEQKWAQEYQKDKATKDMKMRQLLNESDGRFRRIAELSQVGMVVMKVDGTIVYANDIWYSLTQTPRGIVGQVPWMSCVAEEDVERAARNFEAVKRGSRISQELRLNKPWSGARTIHGEAEDGVTWVTVACTPELDADGVVQSIMAALTEISSQKWAEAFEKRKTQEATDAKVQQSRFVDMVSHEMRNPLSAIIQSADFILSAAQPSEDMAEIRELAETIAMCAQHQRRIIDDTITLSRLDSHLLRVMPVDVQPVSIIASGLKMFEVELAKSFITFETQVAPSYRSLKVDHVRLDPCRLLQILINLVGNAVKFTRSEEARHITITVGASLERPTDSSSGFAYPGQDPSSTDPTADPQWGTGECLFLEFTVQDTGKSLSESEKSMLFKHGSTANPKTHVEYGGSGLGLFISRELIEMQGGEIGVASEPEGGTTFGFYIKTRRAPGSNTTAVALPEILRARSGSISTLRSLSSAVTAADIQFQEKPRVALVVEDNLINQKILARGLRKDGWTVAVANHGQEALDYIKASKHWRGNEANGGEYCVVLMDVEMPVMDGITCLKTIRALEAEGSIGVRVPIIAVTANARSEQVTEAMEAGMDDFVSKPCRIHELTPKMAFMLDRV